MTHEQKIAALEAMLADEPGDDLTHFLLGREYMEVKRWTDAARVLARCVEINPRYSAAYRFLGDAHRLAGDAAAARDAYERGMAVAAETGDLQAGKEMQAMAKKVQTKDEG